MTEKKKQNKNEKVKLAGAVTANEKQIHPRGKTFEGVVKSKFQKRIAIEFERTVYVRKYERYAMSKTRIHARLPTTMEKEINVGDLVRVQECRPLSKIIHFVVVEKLKDASEIKESKK